MAAKWYESSDFRGLVDMHINNGDERLLASFDGEKTKQAKVHASCMTLPDPAELRAFGVKVKAAKLEYNATVLRAKVDSSGKVVKLQYTVPFNAGLMGKYFLLHLDAAVAGTYKQTVTLTY